MIDNELKLHFYWINCLQDNSNTQNADAGEVWIFIVSEGLIWIHFFSALASSFFHSKPSDLWELAVNPSTNTNIKYKLILVSIFLFCRDSKINIIIQQVRKEVNIIYLGSGLKKVLQGVSKWCWVGIEERFVHYVYWINDFYNSWITIKS